MPPIKKIVCLNSINPERPNITKFLKEFQRYPIHTPFHLKILEQKWWTSALWNKALPELQDCKYILFCDNDIFFHDDFLTPLIKRLEEDSTIGWINPLYINDKGILHCGSTVGFSGYNLVRLEDCDFVKVNEKDIVYPVLWTASSCSLLRMEAIKECGLFDERFYTHLEQDMGFSLWNHSWKVVVDPKVIVRHLQSYTKKKYGTLSRCDWSHELKKYNRPHFELYGLLHEKYGDVREDILNLVRSLQEEAVK